MDFQLTPISTTLTDRIENLIKQQIRVGIVDDYFTTNNNGFGIHYTEIGENSGFVCQVNPKRDPANRALLKHGKQGCFLCEENMPDEEEGIQLDHQWKLYPNPRPYEKNHMVLVRLKYDDDHPFQVISNEDQVRKAVDLIWELGHQNKRSDFNLTFNSTGAGASSRHFHYQLFECELPIINFPIEYKESNGIKVGIVRDYPAGVLVVEGHNQKHVTTKVWSVIDKLNSYFRSYIPYVLLFKVVEGKIRAYIFPRAAERPSDVNPELINTVFGICEMSGLTIVYNDEMSEQIDLETFKESLRVSSDWSITEELFKLI